MREKHTPEPAHEAALQDRVKRLEAENERLRSEIIEPHRLTFIAEALGDSHCGREGSVEAMLVSLTKHPSPAVREGALLGLLARDSVAPYVLDRISVMADQDESPGVRQVAEEAFRELQGGRRMNEEKP